MVLIAPRGSCCLPLPAGARSCLARTRVSPWRSSARGCAHACCRPQEGEHAGNSLAFPCNRMVYAQAASNSLLQTALPPPTCPHQALLSKRAFGRPATSPDPGLAGSHGSRVNAPHLLPICSLCIWRHECFQLGLY